MFHRDSIVVESAISRSETTTSVFWISEIVLTILCATWFALFFYFRAKSKQEAELQNKMDYFGGKQKSQQLSVVRKSAANTPAVIWRESKSLEEIEGDFSFLVLPTEMLVEIFSKIQDPFTLRSCILTCHKWREVILENDRLLWKPVCIEEWKLDCDAVLVASDTWRQAFKQSNRFNDNSVKKTFDRIQRNANYRFFFLDSLSFPAIPSKLFTFNNLMSLNMIGNKMRKIPDELFQLTQLEWLYLNSNEISEIPPEITKLKNLQELALSSNRITKLPVEFSQLTTLRYLSIRSNSLEASTLDNIPSSVRHLFIGNNNFTSLPESLTRLKELYTLCAGSNQLKELPAKFTELVHLHTLDLSQNQFTKLPMEILQATSKLTYINFENNPLAKPLPTEIWSLPQLSMLRVDQ